MVTLFAAGSEVFSGLRAHKSQLSNLQGLMAHTFVKDTAVTFYHKFQVHGQRQWQCHVSAELCLRGFLPTLET